MTQVRVLEVAYCFGYGGIRACIQNYITHLDKDKFQIDLFIYGTDDSPFRSQMEEMGCHMFFDPINYIAENRIKDFVNVLTDFIRRGKYDVVHAHCNLISAWVTLAAWRAGAKVRIAHSHSTAHMSNSFIQNCWCYLRRWIIDKTATTKMACGQLAGEAMYGKKAKFAIMQNGIDVERFIHRNEDRIKELRRHLAIPEGVKVYANITRMDSQKNHIFAVEVFNEIHKIDPTAIFIYGGVIPKEGSTVDMVQAKIRDYGIEEFTRFTGPVMGVESLYQMTDLWLYTSAYEGLPFGPIELQAASVPTIASDVITKEIDLGLGLVQFLSLDAPFVEWARLAVKTTKKQINDNEVFRAFNLRKFNINETAKELAAIYKDIKK